MKQLLPSVWLIALLLGTPCAIAQDSAERRVLVNDPVIAILGAGLDDQTTRMLWDIADVTGSEDLRVLPILGSGSLGNVVDLLYLDGVDGAVMQSDTLNYYASLGREADLRDKIVSVATLGRQMAHLLAHRDIESIDDLEGRRVNFGGRTSGSVVSASQIFDQLSIAVEATNLDHPEALDALRAGEIDAMFWMAPPPAAPLDALSPADDLHFLPIPADRVDADMYPKAALEAGAYPILDRDVETVSTLTLLAAYNWPGNDARRAKLERFAAALRANLETLRSDAYHPSFKTVVADETVPGGWNPLK